MTTNRLPPTLLASFLSAISFAAAALAQAPPTRIDFIRDVKPILSNNCFQCHGPDTEQVKGGTDGLRLDIPDGAIADLGGYAAVVAGHPEKSALVERIVSKDPDAVMPPAATGKKLSPREISILTEWVRQGGKYVQHWSYTRPVRPELPAVQDGNWPKNEIDRFILSRLEKEGLKPAPEADRYTLIRRLSLDLTGLPPTLEEVDAFVADTDPQAYEKLIDRLIAKPAYGEHWGHLWLDLARYADSAGYADDPPRVIWLFRDYVIRALNANKPFDQFTVEQIAGDLLPNPTEEQLTATAFHRNTLTNNEGGTNDEEYRSVAVVDRVNTTLAVWMGTTIACAQCHNHKYDPLSQEEFFRLYAFFNNTDDADVRDESPLLSIYTDEQQRQRSAWQQELAQLESVLKTPTPALQAGQKKWEQSFPLNLAWQTLKPKAVTSQSGMKTTIKEDGAVLVTGEANNDVYTVSVPLEAGKLRALRLEALPEDSLPAKGPGHAAGNFILSGVSAKITPPVNQKPSGRFVRIEIPGKQRILSLAEVQVFQGKDNIALRGEASQSSTASDGPAKLAIDGNTNGQFTEAKSTSHTATTDDPWWEVDLKSEQPLDRIVVWNRTDAGVETRLSNYRVLLLNDKHEPVWQQMAVDPPKPSTEFSPGGDKVLAFDLAVADYAQSGFEPENVLNNKAPKQKGWAVGGQIGQPHFLTLVIPKTLEIAPGSTLTVTLDHAAQTAKQTLGHFRLSLTDDDRAAEYGRTPQAILAALQIADAERTPPQQAAISKHYLSIAPELQAERKQLAKVTSQLADLKPMTVPIMRERDAAKRRVTKIQHRGNFLDVGKDVTEGTPAIFPSLPADAPRNRLTLARWLVDDNNPLTSRVIANRYWEQLFGIGIVATSEEFGAQGDLPFNPELLDWLATELVRLRWDMKAFLKSLVMSAAYRQSSHVTSDLQQRDPDNRLLARGPRFRLSAEMVRDQALYVSGLLSPKMHGPPVKPPQPAMGLSAAFGSGIDWQTSSGEDRYRRALYTTWRRSNPYPSMATFDAPNREVCTVRRGRTNTPLQALVTLNDPVFVEAAQSLARRVASQGGKTSAEKVQYAFRLCLSRPPSASETARLLQLYEQTRQRYDSRPDDAKRMATDPLGAAPADANLADLAAWTVVGNVLLNLDEALMKR
jgi:mono/diheme cytochrome c family protein